jgi:hypothetical protein
MCAPREFQDWHARAPLRERVFEVDLDIDPPLAEQPASSSIRPIWQRTQTRCQSGLENQVVAGFVLVY